MSRIVLDLPLHHNNPTTASGTQTQPGLNSGTSQLTTRPSKELLEDNAGVLNASPEEAKSPSNPEGPLQKERFSKVQVLCRQWLLGPHTFVLGYLHWTVCVT